MSDDSQNSLTAASNVLTLAHGLHAGDLEVILLTVLMAVDENHVPCSKEATSRIVAFLTKLSQYDAALPLG